MGAAESSRSEALEHLRHATGYDADVVLQEMVDDVRGVFGADLCIVHLMLPEGMYFRAWSGPLPEEFAESKIISKEMSLCPPVVESASPIVVENLLETEGLRDHFACRVGGMRFYAGTPLVTSEGTAVGTLCLLDHRSKSFTGDGLKTLQAFGRAVVGRLETLGSLGRERSAREEEARRSRELRRVLDSSTDIITTVGLDGVFRTMNPACRAVVGYEPEELIGKVHTDLVHPVDCAHVREATRALSRGEPVVGFQGRYLRKDGGVAWVEWNATALPEEGIFYCVARDISERKRIEGELRHQLDLTAATMNSLGEGVYTVDGDGRVTSLNPAAERMLGWTEEELLGADMHEKIHYRRPDGTSLPAELCPLLKVLQSGKAHRSDVDDFVRRDGTLFPVSYNSSPIEREGEVTGAVVAFSDDTERRRAEERLRQQKDLYETLLEAQSAVGEGLVILQGSRVVYANEAFCEISGYSPEELEAMPSLFELIPEERRQDAKEKLHRRLSGERAEGHLETAVVQKSGRRVDLEVGARLLREDVPRLIVVARDISERKDAERRLRAQFEVTCLLEEAATLEEASPEILRLVCENLGWAAGGLWAVDRRAGKLRRVRMWRAPGDGIGASEAGTGLDVLSPGEGLPGRVWASGEPAWIPDTGRGADIPRSSILSGAGLHAAIAVPILLQGEVLGVMEFFDREVRDPDEAALETIGTIGIQTGQFMERREAEQTLRQSEERFRATFEQAAVGVSHVGTDGRWLKVNRRLCEILGYEEGELLGLSSQDVTHPDDLEKDLRRLEGLLRGETATYSMEKRYLRKDGSSAWVNLTVSLLKSPSGEPEYFISVIEDITGRKVTEEALRRAEEKYRGIFENAVEGIFQVSTDWRLLTVNPAMARIYGYASPGEMMADFPHAGRLYGDRERRAVLERNVHEHGFVSNFEARVCRKDGGWIWVSANVRALRNASGEAQGYEGTIEDITERKALEERLEYQAFHDPLTGLPNRALFLDRLRQALARTDRRDDSVAVLFLDLDGFKAVNDSLGHDVGDRLLVAAAGRIESCVRLGDTVARLGGDEFTVLLEDVAGVEEAVQVADRIAAELSNPFELAGEEVRVTSSVGICVSTTFQDRPEDLMRDADLAMYRAKETGKAHHRVFEERMGAAARSRLRMAGELRRAVDRGEFRIYYQPLVMLDGGKRVAGMEALLRWEHPRRGLLVPAEFLPVAEETGLILPIGLWVLEEACRQATSWRRERPEESPRMLCVNLSAKQLQAPELVDDVARTLQRTGLPPDCLNLELSDGALVGDGTLSRMRELKDLGVLLTVDDLGGRGDSLSLPKRLPVDFLKIDRSVVEGLVQNPKDAAVASAFIDLAGAFGVGVIAEGIETTDQIARLREMGCTLGQGYHFSSPVPGLDAPWTPAPYEP